MKTSLIVFILFIAARVRADGFWTYGSPQSHVLVQEIRAMKEINFPDEPLGTSPTDAVRVALKRFAERFPETKPPVVESVGLQRFPEEYGKNRFFYAVHLRPLSAQSLDSSGSLLRTDKYQVLVPLPFQRNNLQLLALCYPSEQARFSETLTYGQNNET